MVAAVVGSHGAIAGEGLFANCSIMPGSRIIEDVAIIDVLKTETIGELHELLTASGQYAKFDTAEGRVFFRGNPAGKQAQEYQEWAEEALDNADERADCVQSLLAIGFNAYTDPGMARQLLFPILSKANHSCFANAAVRVHSGVSAEIVCLRPISEGDEITVSYLTDHQLGMPAQVRQGHLNELWEFTCSCARCARRHDDTRCLSCPQEGCGGRCTLVKDDHLGFVGLSGCIRCHSCGMQPSEEFLTSSYTLEIKVEQLVNSLPDGLYSAWCVCNEFAEAHPQHWLSSVWWRHLAAHNEQEAESADTLDEAEELRLEATQMLAAADRYIEVLFSTARSKELLSSLSGTS